MFCHNIQKTKHPLRRTGAVLNLNLDTADDVACNDIDNLLEKSPEFISKRLDFNLCNIVCNNGHNVVPIDSLEESCNLFHNSYSFRISVVLSTYAIEY